MPNYGDDPIRRAAGVILFAMERGAMPSEAIAKAARREPQLTDAQLRHAAAWAIAAQSMRDCCAPWKLELADHERAAGVTMRDKLGQLERGTTMGELLERSEVAYYRDPANYPPDEE